MSSLPVEETGSDPFEVSSPLPAPPVVVIPGKQIPNHIKRTRSSVEVGSATTTTPITPVDENGQIEEKTGRWSESEHSIFLEGLEQHGKQWKTISSMIGTRTVVQVRTHAQKYFQKMERKNSKNGGGRSSTTSSTASTMTHYKAGKRKSLPTSLPSRKKSARQQAQLSKGPMTRTASLSLASMDVSPSSGSDNLQTFVSTSSLSSRGNWSTESPSGVDELGLQLSPSAQEASCSNDNKEPMFLAEEPLPAQPEASSDDPLDWLIDGGFGDLPESSLAEAPMFPGLEELPNSSTVEVENNESPSGAAEAAAAAASSVVVNYPQLQEIADPKVTVQALFLDDGELP